MNYREFIANMGKTVLLMTVLLTIVVSTMFIAINK
jgi:hypothetical protein